MIQKNGLHIPNKKNENALNSEIFLFKTFI
jgi:hypothetical protein